MSERSRFAPLLARAPAKINLGLFVGPTRADGRHELASVMQSISLCDELELAPAPGTADELRCPGVAGAPQHNLAMRALVAFREASGWRAPAASIAIAKAVPVAAGLGGGSADAAAVLRLAAAASGLVDQELLQRIAVALGADVPAQVRPGRWLATGAGERLQALPDGGVFAVLVMPSRASLSTAAVYGELDRRGSARSAQEVSERAHELSAALVGGAALPPRELLANDLQEAALALEPSIGDELEAVGAAGADLAMLSGSGPTVLGLFGGPDPRLRALAAAEELRRRRAALGASELPAPVVAEPVAATYGDPRPARGVRGVAQQLRAEAL